MSNRAGAYEEAPARYLPQTTFYSVEYPSFLVSSSASATAIETLGGLDAVNAAFRRPAGTRPVEFNFNPSDPFRHPILGETLEYRGIVLKIVKRRRRGKATTDGENDPGNSSSRDGGVYTAEALGISRKVARFRAMADFSFQAQEPNPILDLRTAMDTLDAKFIADFRMGPEAEDYVLPPDPSSGSSLPISNMRLIPPPRFSSTLVPGRYEYKQNTSSVPTIYTDEVTGEERSRFTNKFKSQQDQGTTITFDDPGVPSGPPTVTAKLGQTERDVLEAVQKLLEERPVWSRLALLNRLTRSEAHVLVNMRSIYFLSGYVMSDGPWRDFIIRWGYDPRVDQAARFYQRLQFRNIQNEHTRPNARLEDAGNKEPSERDESEALGKERLSHVFDGKTLRRTIGTFQFCDVEDPLLRTMVWDEKNLGKECTMADGWYDPVAIERIKAIARRKFAGLLEGRVVTDDECADLLAEAEPHVAIRAELRKAAEGRKVHGHRRNGRLTILKGHNMAIPPVAPEELAAERLRRALQKEQDGQVSASSDDEA